MTTTQLTNGRELLDVHAYERSGHPHEAFTELRRHDPVHRCETDEFPPFWAITKHDHILEISTQPNLFLNEPGIVLLPKDQEPSVGGIGEMRTIIQMDPPDHREYRKVASAFFTPRAIAHFEQATLDSAKGLVDRMAEAGREGEIDLAADIAAMHPLRVLATILGLSREAEPVILRLTNQLFAADDDELRRPGVDRQTAMQELGMELFMLFDEVIQDRRANPRDDLVSVIANATIDGQPMGPMETFGYCLIAFTAGHDTTKNAVAGGLNAFIDHPGQLAALRDDPALAATAVDEIVRWSTPVNYMMRTAAADTEVGGKHIAEGDRLVLFYASANRDEDVYDDPFTFRIDRQENRHLGFGIGEHFCMGAHLARMTQRALYREFASRVAEMEHTAPPSWIRSNFVVGFKHVPVRYRML